MRRPFHILRAALTYAVMGAATILYGTTVIVIGLLRPASPLMDRIASHWGRVFCWMAGVRLTVRGLEHIQPGVSYVVVSNHLSNFDTMSHLAGLPLPIRFLAKAELFRIPVFGAALRAVGMVRVDRGGGRAEHGAINRETARAVELGRSLMIYPEGTRPRDGRMKKFKKGAFTIARNLQVPVLPTAIVGSREVWSPGRKLIRPGPIRVTVMAPRPTAGLEKAELNQLVKEVEACVREAAEPDGEPAPAR